MKGRLVSTSMEPPEGLAAYLSAQQEVIAESDRKWPEPTPDAGPQPPDEDEVLDEPTGVELRRDILESAAQAVLSDRAMAYGDPEDSFGLISVMWSNYLGVAVSPRDVAAMMVLLKVSRVAANPGHTDSWIDIAGYAACGGALPIAEEDL